MTQRRLSRHISWIVFGLTSIVSAACGDDEDSTTSEVSTEDAGPGGKASGGSGAKSSSAGKAGASAEASGGKGGSAGKGGSGGSTSTPSTPSTPAMMEAACTEEAPSEPVKCGDETCVAPTFAMNSCVVSCCIEVGGVSKCGAKSTSEMFPAACALPAEPDSACPAVSGQAGDMQGCCNTQLGKCGIISSARPGCITESMFVEIPDVACTKLEEPSDADGGVEDRDAG